MAKKSDSHTRNALIIFGVLAIVIIVFFAYTDTFQLLSIATLSLDASGKRGNLIERGADGLTGNFKLESKILSQIDKFENKIDKFEEQIDNLELKLDTPKAEEKPQFRNQVTGKIERIEDRIDKFEDRIEFLKGKLQRGEPPEPTPTLPPINEPPEVEILPTAPNVDVINVNPEQKIVVVRNVAVTKGNVEQPSSGIPSSTVGLEGLQTLIREKITVHDSFHTPANGQTTTGTLLIEWGHQRSITVSQFLVPNDYFDWFEVKLPQRIAGEGLTSKFDGVNHGEFKYKITIPEDLVDATTVIPVRIVVDSELSPLDGYAEIQIERPHAESKSFSVAEWIRGFLAELRT